MIGLKQERSHSGAQSDKSFTKSGGLKRHRRTHTRENPFKCTLCDKSFLESSELKIHERSHTGEKPFQCTKCDKSFSRAGITEIMASKIYNLKRHERTHTGEKPFKCIKCEKRFSRAGILKCHDERTHKNLTGQICNQASFLEEIKREPI